MYRLKCVCSVELSGKTTVSDNKCGSRLYRISKIDFPCKIVSVTCLCKSKTFGRMHVNMTNEQD